MVGEGGDPFAATPEPRLMVSPHAALQYEGCCHQHRWPCIWSWQWIVSRNAPPGLTYSSRIDGFGGTLRPTTDLRRGLTPNSLGGELCRYWAVSRATAQVRGLGYECLANRNWRARARLSRVVF